MGLNSLTYNSHCLNNTAFGLSCLYHPFIIVNTLVGYFLPQHINKLIFHHQRPLQYYCCSFTQFSGCAGHASDTQEGTTCPKKLQIKE